MQIYKAKLDSSVMLFLVIGISVIGYFIDMKALAVIILTIVVLGLLAVSNFIYSDIEFVIDSRNKTVSYSFARLGKVFKNTYKVEELEYRYQNVVTSSGKFNTFSLIQNGKTIVKTRPNIYSFTENQIQDIIKSLSELQVKESI
ncbi:hypothetical protein H4K35_06945 [Myroides sp. NP-2]|uniref:hypothetical protein n=1 Tax=Myroides sp. NP-2 TaxID=2759945 RepID=UPI0015FC997B|nr:hypothetical protein [Myroides sp. NP-2]MBB1149872.1 hypothetical protein [Myroides sp. NP-2]